MATGQEYITSERFIHDELLRRSAATIDKLYDLWSRDRRIDPTVLAWPAERVKTDDGHHHAGVVFCRLPDEVQARPAQLRDLIKRVRPYALLLVEQRKGMVKAIFESMHGARCWTLPVKNHGGVRILGEAAQEDDRECIGLLWRPGEASQN
jgi:hypothetical protein